MDGFDPGSRFGSRRRLLAIMAADVAGYSRLIGENEARTLALMADRRAEMDALIEQHHGRIANTAGDSVLAEFGSVVNAVACAIAVQRQHDEAHGGTEADQQVRFRIGIHIGDILIRDGDLFGDGVNIAARVEALAEPGGIALSGKARDEIRGRFDVAFQDGGVLALKNIRSPVHVWRIAPGAPVGQDIGQDRAPAPRAAPLLRQRRLAAGIGIGLVAALGVLAVALTWRGGDALPAYSITPFAAAGDEAAARPLAAALSAHIASGVGAMPYLRLLRGEQGTRAARYDITGTVAVTGTATHVDARIVETATGKVLASVAFDPPAREPELMQQEILGAIGDDLSVEINKLRFPAPPATAETRRARQLAQEARAIGGDSRADPGRALALFAEANRLSPDDLDIQGWHANTLIAVATSSKQPAEQRKTHLDRVRALLARGGEATRFHRLFGYARCQLANYDGAASEAVTACDETRQVTPWSARVFKEIGTAYLKLGVLDRALGAFTQAERLDRRHFVRWTWEMKAGIAALFKGDNAAAADWLRAAVALRKDDLGMQGLLAVVYKRPDDQPALARQSAVVLGMAEMATAMDAVEELLSTQGIADPAVQGVLTQLRTDMMAMR